jgi:hypothetical protein
VVHKFEIPYAESYARMPEEAEILHVEAIVGKVYAWALVDPKAKNVARAIGYFATGDPIPENAVYRGTAISEDRAFVWHVFEYGGES